MSVVFVTRVVDMVVVNPQIGASVVSSSRHGCCEHPDWCFCCQPGIVHQHSADASLDEEIQGLCDILI